MSIAYFSLGSNLGDPVQNIIDARKRLFELQNVSVHKCSSLYVTSPVGYDDQQDFVNCVVELTVTYDYFDLFMQAQNIEIELGRKRDLNNQNAPRVIDIDLLLFDDVEFISENLVIPHPRMHQRLFVLQPLLEINNDVSIPSVGRASDLMLDNDDFVGQDIIKLGV